MNRAYLDAVRLLLAVAPSIFRQPGFALKGGTEFNFPDKLKTGQIPKHAVITQEGKA